MEFKIIDSGTTNAGVITSAGTLNLLNGVAQGIDYTNRTGRKITMESLMLRIFGFLNTAVNNDSGDVLRIMVIHDSQTNKTAPTLANILTTSDFAAPNNLNNRLRFTTLSNTFIPIKPYRMNAAALSAGAPSNIIEEIYLDLNLDTTFSGAGATISDITTGSIYVLFITLNSAVSVLYNSRIKFSDA